MAYQPTIWRLSDLKGPGGPVPDIVDPQTNGKVWEVYNIQANEEIKLLWARVLKGERSGAHTHKDAEHWIYIVEGTGLVWMDGTMVKLQAGELIHIPSDVLHDFGADSTGDLWVYDLTNPPWTLENMYFDPSRDGEIAAAFEETLTK